MTDKTTKPASKITAKVEGRSSHFTHSFKVLLELQDMILDGWRVDTEQRGIGQGVVLTRSKVRVPLFKVNHSEETLSIGVDQIPQKPEEEIEPTDQETKEEVVELTDEQKVKNIEEGILAAGKFKREEMLWFAAQKGIDMPEGLTNPLQIRKHIKESLES